MQQSNKPNEASREPPPLFIFNLQLGLAPSGIPQVSFTRKSEQICICNFLSSDRILVDRVATCDLIANFVRGKEVLLRRAKLLWKSLLRCEHLKRICIHYLTCLVLALCCKYYPQPRAAGGRGAERLAGGFPVGLEGNSSLLLPCSGRWVSPERSMVCRGHFSL